ncbi:SMI1/KNR4 family protein [Metabacillus idriensis]|uniref:SMI1/KNR4 family protein n=1 Tax=Metabacillus idriensis TaxID=324768 RepID=UPI00203F5BB1|nr:SMI1/KNR4 family protein [Metabacillus idriensis]
MNLLWAEEFDEFYKGDIKKEMIEKVQKELKIELPSSYIKLMTKRNGFILNKKYFHTSIPNGGANNYVHINYIYGVGEEPGLLDNIYLKKEWGISSKGLIILSADPPMFVCLDYRNKNNPSVIFIDIDINQEINLASTFEEFICGLEEYIEEEQLISTEELSKQQIQDYNLKIDQLISKGKPKEIDHLLTEILSTNNELIRHLAEKMRQHPDGKVHKVLLLFLLSCAQGDNKGILKDEYLYEILEELKNSKNREAKELALFSLQELNKRISFN